MQRANAILFASKKLLFVNIFITFYSGYATDAEKTLEISSNTTTHKPLCTYILQVALPYEQLSFFSRVHPSIWHLRTSTFQTLLLQGAIRWRLLAVKRRVEIRQRCSTANPRGSTLWIWRFKRQISSPSARDCQKNTHRASWKRTRQTVYQRKQNGSGIAAQFVETVQKQRLA